MPDGDAAASAPTGWQGDRPTDRARCRVELFGLARSIVGERALEVDLPGDATVADALARLAADRPALVGRVIRPDGTGLTEGHVMNLNGREFVEDAATAVAPGDTLLILANTAGG